MKNRGQALVEFVMILPIIMLIILGSVDLGNLFIAKYSLINNLDQIVEHKDNPEVIDHIVEDNDLKYLKSYDQGVIKYSISKKVNLFTPGLNMILESPYYLTTERRIYE